LAKFDREMECHQIAWRRTAALSSGEFGLQNGRRYEWILPARSWEDGLWPGIQSTSGNSLPAYLDKDIKRHSGSHNLKSSWILCANLYFPFGAEPGMALLAGFLQHRVDPRIQNLDALELEYAEPLHSALHPSKLLGETAGTRGAVQTSPDVAFRVSGNGYRGLVLTEVKFTEHSFYGCSARRRKDGSDPLRRPGNPDPERCNSLGNVLANLESQCHQVRWGRKYWEHLGSITDKNALSDCCPAAHTGYQLLRQQALAEGIAASGEYDFVLSCAAIDDRNDILKKKLTSLDWKRFARNVPFTVFTHQCWVEWVRTHGDLGQWGDWLEYVDTRYGFRKLS